jgi:hypothetical protein
VSDTIHLVYSRRPDSITEEEYNRWYDRHLAEILVVPGFVSARRYALSPDVVERENPVQFTHLALYGVAGDVPDVMNALRAEAASGRMDLPAWFDEIRFASWNANPLGATCTPRDAHVVAG